MLFTNPVFFLFFLFVYLLYLRLPFRRQNLLLLLASYIFYGWWDYRFLGLLLISTIVDYFCGISLEKIVSEGKRKCILAISVCTNLGILGFFKYFDFFIENIRTILIWLGLEPGALSLGIIVPVGISFYTFQTMSYTIEVYRRKQQPCRSIFDFGLYVSFFPQLVAGPIERPQNLLEQICKPRYLNWNAIHEGAYLILQGYFLKTVIADNAGKITDPFFAHNEPSGLMVLLGVYAYALQIYGDFAGYSRIARGLSRIMGFQLMQNFRRPYFAVDPSDFWRRWHISLSTWLRDYLYIPLGGNRVNPFRTHVNLLLTMTIGGLWHGAAWNFVLWGLYHGIILIVFHIGENSFKFLNKHILSRILRVIAFFQLTCVGWLLFRSDSFQRITIMLNGLTAWKLEDFNIHEPSIFAFLSLFVFTLVYDGACAAGEYVSYHRENNLLSPQTFGLAKLLCALAMIVTIFLMGQRAGTAFIYFQF